jgi:hypothetical protein
MPCIYCKTTDHLTEEHVFSAFSGGNIVVKDGSCSKCNGECSKFEDKVASATETARHIFEIPNRYGRVPDAAVKIDVQGTKLAAVSIDGRRKPGGEIELHDFVMDTKTEDGKKVREGFFVSEEGARKFVERRRARGEKVTEIEAPGEVILVPNSQQTIEFAFSPAARQMAAKIALTSVAYVYGTANVSFAMLLRFHRGFSPIGILWPIISGRRTSTVSALISVLACTRDGLSSLCLGGYRTLWNSLASLMRRKAGNIVFSIIRRRGPRSIQ